MASSAESLNKARLANSRRPSVPQPSSRMTTAGSSTKDRLNFARSVVAEGREELEKKVRGEAFGAAASAAAVATGVGTVGAGVARKAGKAVGRSRVGKWITYAILGIILLIFLFYVGMIGSSILVLCDLLSCS